MNRDPYTDKTVPKYPDTDMEDVSGMFISPAFWIGGVVSLAVMAAFAWIAFA